jgi:hypothetical protein
MVLGLVGMMQQMPLRLLPLLLLCDVNTLAYRWAASVRKKSVPYANVWDIGAHSGIHTLHMCGCGPEIMPVLLLLSEDAHADAAIGSGWPPCCTAAGTACVYMCINQNLHWSCRRCSALIL